MQRSFVDNSTSMPQIDHYTHILNFPVLKFIPPTFWNHVINFVRNPTLSLREFVKVCVVLNAHSDILFYSTHPLATERWDGQVG